MSKTPSTESSKPLAATVRDNNTKVPLNRAAKVNQAPRPVLPKVDRTKNQDPPAAGVSRPAKTQPSTTPEKPFTQKKSGPDAVTHSASPPSVRPEAALKPLPQRNPQARPNVFTEVTKQFLTGAKNTFNENIKGTLPVPLTAVASAFERRVDGNSASSSEVSLKEQAKVLTQVPPSETPSELNNSAFRHLQPVLGPSGVKALDQGKAAQVAGGLTAIALALYLAFKPGGAKKGNSKGISSKGASPSNAPALAPLQASNSLKNDLSAKAPAPDISVAPPAPASPKPKDIFTSGKNIQSISPPDTLDSPLFTSLPTTPFQAHVSPPVSPVSNAPAALSKSPQTLPRLSESFPTATQNLPQAQVQPEVLTARQPTMETIGERKKNLYSSLQITPPNTNQLPTDPKKAGTALERSKHDSIHALLGTTEENRVLARPVRRSKYDPFGAASWQTRAAQSPEELKARAAEKYGDLLPHYEAMRVQTWNGALHTLETKQPLAPIEAYNGIVKKYVEKEGLTLNTKATAQRLRKADSVALYPHTVGMPANALGEVRVVSLEQALTKPDLDPELHTAFVQGSIKTFSREKRGAIARKAKEEDFAPDRKSIENKYTFYNQNGAISDPSAQTSSSIPDLILKDSEAYLRDNPRASLNDYKNKVADITRNAWVNTHPEWTWGPSKETIKGWLKEDIKVRDALLGANPHISKEWLSQNGELFKVGMVPDTQRSEILQQRLEQFDNLVVPDVIKNATHIFKNDGRKKNKGKGPQEN
jgi:hypothetical protein